MLAGLMESVRVLLEHIVLSLGYVGITIVMFIENIFPPIPSEVIIPFSGFLISEGELSFVPTLIATGVGSLLGALFFYYLGVVLGEARTRSLFKRYGKFLLLYESDLDHSLSFFNRHSSAVVFWARFIPGIRSLISIPAGVARMNVKKFLAYTILGTTIWNTALMVAGIYLGQNWEEILVFVDRFDTILYVLIAALITWWLVGRLRARREERLARRDGQS